MVIFYMFLPGRGNRNPSFRRQLPGAVLLLRQRAAADHLRGLDVALHGVRQQPGEPPQLGGMLGPGGCPVGILGITVVNHGESW